MRIILDGKERYLTKTAIDKIGPFNHVNLARSPIGCGCVVSAVFIISCTPIGRRYDIVHDPLYSYNENKVTLRTLLFS